MRVMNGMADAIIIGGGLNGTALAVALGRAGLSATIIDPLPRGAREDPAFDGRGYALAHASKRLLEAIGVWDSVAGYAQPILDIKVTDGRPGKGASPFLLELDHAEIEEGPMGWMVEDRHLRRALLAALEGLGAVSQVSGAAVMDHDAGEAAAVARMDDGRLVSGRMIAAADGAASPAAKRAGIERFGWGYGQTALVCAIAHERPHCGTAHQFFMPAGPLAILPLPDSRSSLVWTETDKEAARIQKLGDSAYLAELRPRVGSFLGDFELAGMRFAYPLALSIAHRVAGHRLALLGDAAHQVHPIAGQGLNAGFKDVGTLAEILIEANRRGEDIGQIDVLERYQSWRRFDTATLALATDGFNRVFSNDNSLLRLGRGIGMSLINAMPGLRRGLIREAAGLTGELPRLLQGKPI